MAKRGKGGMGVPASPPGHSDEPASGLAADAGSVPNAIGQWKLRCTYQACVPFHYIGEGWEDKS